MPRTPTAVDPRSHVAQSRLEEDPRLKVMWAGYAFSKDFREERGHAYMLDDQTFTERQQVTQQPGTCMNCHDSLTMQLRVTRPAFIESLRALAASDDPVPHLTSIEHWRQHGRNKGATRAPTT